MAPAGSYEALQAAVQAGADAVYFGVGQLNMRSKSAANFTPDDLERIVGIARAAGVKSYLTVNTVIYEDELRQMHALVDRARAAGVDAVIASDLSAILYARRIGMEVHISTQCNLTNSEAVKFFSQWADVVVLARELSLDQIGRIARAIDEQQICGPSGDPVRIEMFAHGALCMAVSGKCYMSLHDANRSANRGECVQICRRSYTVTDNETGNQLEIDNKYIMSPKDLKTIRFIDKMMKAGVRVFKIEGRARGPEYVHEVVTCYKEAISSVIEGTYTEKKKDAWDERLKTVFNRGFWDGYYQGQKMGEWTRNYGNKATERKVLVGKVIKYFSKLGVAEIAVEASEIALNEKMLITGTTTGVMKFTASEIRYDLKPVDRAEKGWRVSLPVPDKVRPNDKVYKIVRTKVEE